MVIRQYPYQLEIMVQQPDTVDGNGATIPGSKDWVFVCSCRDEAGNGKKVVREDGVVYDYSFLIQCPRGIEPVADGTFIRVLNSIGNVRCKGQVVHARKDQLHTRIWV